MPENMFHYIEELNPYYQPSRYPGVPSKAELKIGKCKFKIFIFHFSFFGFWFFENIDKESVIMRQAKREGKELESENCKF